MKILLDTHTFLWWCADDSRLSPTARDAISSAENEVYISAVNGWEIAIKARIGRLLLPEPPSTFMVRMLDLHRFDVLAITLAHAVAEYELPEHHKDPFDRLLVAQSEHENTVLVTNDPQIERYEISTIW